MSLEPGDRLGPYEIRPLLGVGGMGEVYRGRDTRLGRDVALKVISPKLVGDEASRHRFEREARAASALTPIDRDRVRRRRDRWRVVDRDGMG